MSIPAGKPERVKILFGSFSFACSAVSWVMHYHYFFPPCCLRRPLRLFHAHHPTRGFPFDSCTLDAAAETSMKPRVVVSTMAMCFPGCVLNSLQIEIDLGLIVSLVMRETCTKPYASHDNNLIIHYLISRALYMHNGQRCNLLEICV